MRIRTGVRRWLAAAVALSACSQPAVAPSQKPSSPATSSSPPVARIPAGPFPIALSPGFGSMWVVAHNGPWVEPIDPSTGRAGNKTKVGPFPRAIVAGSGSLWVAESGNGTVTRIDPRSGRVVATIPAMGKSNSTVLAAGGGAVWVGDYRDGPGIVTRVSPKKNRVTMTLRIGHASLAFGGGSLWAARYDRGNVLRLDPRSGAVLADVHVAKDIFVGPQSFHAGSLWVTSHDPIRGTLYRIVARSESVSKVASIGAGAGAAAVDSGRVWVANGLDYTAEVIDPATGRRLLRVKLGAGQNDNGGPTGLATGFGQAWITEFTATGQVVRVPANGR